jgi:hypothetical protein
VFPAFIIAGEKKDTAGSAVFQRENVAIWWFGEAVICAERAQ